MDEFELFHMSADSRKTEHVAGRVRFPIYKAMVHLAADNQLKKAPARKNILLIVRD